MRSLCAHTKKEMKTQKPYVVLCYIHMNWGVFLFRAAHLSLSFLVGRSVPAFLLALSCGALLFLCSSFLLIYLLTFSALSLSIPLPLPSPLIHPAHLHKHLRTITRIPRISALSIPRPVDHLHIQRRRSRDTLCAKQRMQSIAIDTKHPFGLGHGLVEAHILLCQFWWQIKERRVVNRESRNLQELQPIRQDAFVKAVPWLALEILEVCIACAIDAFIDCDVRCDVGQLHVEKRAQAHGGDAQCCREHSDQEIITSQEDLQCAAEIAVCELSCQAFDA